MSLLWWLLGAGAAIAGLAFYGQAKWRSLTEQMQDQLEAHRRPISQATFNLRELEGLPDPVQRYFRAALVEGQAMIEALDLKQTGKIDLGKSAERWKPFRATQRVITHRRGFDWDARIDVVPGVAVHVRDSFVGGDGFLHAALLGLIPFAKTKSSPDLARGELMRFVAEGAWYPTALLPSQGVRWEPVHAHAARAIVKDGELEVALLFHFSSDKMISHIRAEARGMLVDGKSVPTPWQCRLWNYSMQSGMRIPMDGEAAWLLPEGAKAYWRGRVTELVYEFARPHA